MQSWNVPKAEEDNVAGIGFVQVTGVATVDGKGYISHLKLTAMSAVSGGSPIISADVTLTNINKAFTITPPAPSDVTAVTPDVLKQALPSS
ncbi:MAG: hypothetical protein ABI276_05710 [Acidimicrobiales bacterium]